MPHPHASLIPSLLGAAALATPAVAAETGSDSAASTATAQGRADPLAELFHDYQVLKVAPGALNQRGRELLDQAAAYHREQVRRAEQILASASAPEPVLDLAQRVATDHERAYKKLNLLAKLHGIELAPLASNAASAAPSEPTGAGSTDRGRGGQPAAQPGATDPSASFASGSAGQGQGELPAARAGGRDAGSASDDAAASDFVQQQVEAHRQALSRLEHLAGRTGSVNLNSYIDATLPVVEAHLTIARRLDAEAQAGGDERSLVERGRYLARVGDCMACHTRDGGQPYAGGKQLDTPYGGFLVTPNITPSPQGIGDFSDRDFIAAMHQGERPDGEPYYPAFPYPSFTKTSEADVLAIKAYLDTLEPSSYQPAQHQLPWPLGVRESLYAWQQAFFEPGRYQPDSSKSDTWNRGAYLVQGLGHCGACHTPRNIGGAKDRDQALTGAVRQGWYAPSLTPGLDEGVDNYSVEQLVELLQSGMAETKGADGANGSNEQSPEAGPEAALLGPMAEVVHSSLSHLKREDVRAMAVYLKDRQPAQAPAERSTDQHRLPAQMAELGESIYQARCAACHREHGQGQPPYVPSLRRNPILDEPKANNLVMSILAGAPGEAGQAYSPYVWMPSYADTLDDTDVAAVAGYLLARWGDQPDPRVDTSLVAKLRKQVDGD